MEFGLESVPVPKAAELQKDGWTLVDVRLAENFNYGHIEGSVSIPLYRQVQGDTMFDNIKRLAMASFAMKATGAFVLHAPMRNDVSHRQACTCKITMIRM